MYLAKMGLKSKMKDWRKYSEMSNLGIIARRKFFNNAFDGALTCAGIVSGSFIIFLSNPGQNLSSTIIVITGFSTALAIGISGLWGAFLSEEAERKKKMFDLKKEMVIFKEETGESDESKEITKKKHTKKVNLEKIEIQKAMITPINIEHPDQYGKDFLNNKKDKNNENKSLIEQSERFATIVASLVDGGAPVLGSVLPLLPFFFGTVLSLFHFIISYAVLVGILVYLGIFLGNISGGGRLKYTLHLVTAGITTLIVSLLLELAISP
ncbi:MAG: VIT1/CCC1 transporter family protein [Candidatus Lokiarchaeota archaeon]|nr:VIT1/CCC1 transporter family protein [Candidatus Lokiarchaeota archaeon]